MGQYWAHFSCDEGKDGGEEEEKTIKQLGETKIWDQRNSADGKLTLAETWQVSLCELNSWPMTGGEVYPVCWKETRLIWKWLLAFLTNCLSNFWLFFVLNNITRWLGCPLLHNGNRQIRVLVSSLTVAGIKVLVAVVDISFVLLCNSIKSSGIVLVVAVEIILVLDAVVKLK